MNRFEAIEKLATAARAATNVSPIERAIGKLTAKQDVGLEDALELRRAYRDDNRLWAYIEGYFYSIIDSLEGPKEASLEDAENVAKLKRIARAAKFILSGFGWEEHPKGVSFWDKVHTALEELADGHIARYDELPKGKAEQAAMAAKVLMDDIKWVDTPRDFSWLVAYRELTKMANEEEASPASKTPAYVNNAGYLAELCHRVREVTWADHTLGDGWWRRLHAKLATLSANASREGSHLSAQDLLDFGLTWADSPEGESYWNEVWSVLGELS